MLMYSIIKDALSFWSLLNTSGVLSRNVAFGTGLKTPQNIDYLSGSDQFNQQNFSPLQVYYFVNT